MGDKPKIYVKIYDTLLDAKIAKQGFLKKVYHAEVIFKQKK
jgi:hypothetical protein